VQDDTLIQSLTAAVEAAPDDPSLRLHLAELLLGLGRANEALRHLGVVLQITPDSRRAQQLVASAVSAVVGQPRSDELEANEPDWKQLEEQFAGVVEPMFVEGSREPTVADFEIERETITLADVGGLAHVKERLELAFLAPLRNPELRALYGKRLRGGLLLYGPPGCGKSYIARALAGELGAGFLTVSIDDVLDPYLGTSERNLHELFAAARRHRPCVLFMDEIDALGHKRTQLGSNAMRTTVNALLAELDGVGTDNDGMFVLAATNHPWDVDPALRRPGRLDRTVLVLPPDEPARAAIFESNLRDRPIAGIDRAALARRTEGFSGADIAHICEAAAERAMMDAVRSGSRRMIEMSDLGAAIAEVRPSTRSWFETARSVVAFANQSGDYDELARHMKGMRP
jgi:SpoVK/Ycf46/Vps4 family AAA+-type ATPase